MPSNLWLNRFKHFLTLISRPLPRHDPPRISYCTDSCCLVADGNTTFGVSSRASNPQKLPKTLVFDKSQVTNTVEKPTYISYLQACTLVDLKFEPFVTVADWIATYYTFCVHGFHVFLLDVGDRWEIIRSSMFLGWNVKISYNPGSSGSGSCIIRAIEISNAVGNQRQLV